MRKLIKLTDIITDAGTQVRAAINEDTVEEYAEAFRDKAKFPPLDVFHDGSRYLLADGFHRLMGAIRAGVKQLEAEVHQGAKSDCIKFALGANARHGLRMSNSDKRHAVELALTEFPKLSNAALAEICAVSAPFVGDIRREVQPETVSGSNVENPSKTAVLPVPETRIGRDGKERKLPPPPPSKPLPPPPVVAAKPSQVPPPPAAKPVPAAKPAAKPVEPELLDETGYPVPARLIAMWNEAEGVQTLLSAISSVRGALRRAQDEQDKIFAELNFSSVLAHLDQAFSEIKTAKPYAVCTSCQGQMPHQCTFCKGRGFISQFRFDTCVPREVKEIRFKARK